MEFDTFCQRMELEVAERLSGQAPVPERITLEEGHLVVKYADSSIAPRMDLHRMYDKVQEGWEMPVLAGMLAQEMEKMHQKVAGHELTPDAVKRHLRCAVISAEPNEQLLAHTPHEQMLDLAVVPRYYIPNVGSIVFCGEMCQAMRMTGNEVMELAHRNTDRMDYYCKEVTSVIQEIMLGEGLPEKYVGEYIDGLRTDDRNQLYVLTNASRIDGAAALTCKRALCQAREQLGEDYYILPSSVHEVLLVRQSAVDDPSQLEDIVTSINHDMVVEKDRLSDHVYHYDGKTQSIHLVANQPEQNLADVPEEVLTPVSGRGR